MDFFLPAKIFTGHFGAQKKKKNYKKGGIIRNKKLKFRWVKEERFDLAPTPIFMKTCGNR